MRSGALFAIALAAALLPSTPALADRIDGNWCYKTRAMSIDGPNIVTPGGVKMTGDYDRHGFQYTVPAGEPDAGAAVDMIQYDDNTIQVTTKQVRTTGDGESRTEIWNRCKLTM